MNFTEIKIEDKPVFDKLLSYNSYVDAEYLFSTLFMWQDIVGYEMAATDDCIFIRHRDKGKIKYHFPICHPDRALENFRKIYGFAGKSGEKPEFVCITNEQLELLGKERERFNVIEKRNYSDYLYDGEALRTLEGKKLRKKRGHVSNFTKKYNWGFKLFTGEGPELEECREVLQRWGDIKLETSDKKETGLVKSEYSAIERCMKYFTELGFVGGLMYIDGEARGFTIGEVACRGDKTVGVVHYEKCDSEFEGIYQAINQMFAQRALYSVEYINRQEDMGVEGLRKAKLSYYPVRLVDKFTLEEK